MFLGYNTNSLAHHDLIEAIDLVAEIGYESIAITIDHRALNPMSRDISGQLLRVRAILEEEPALVSVTESGGDRTALMRAATADYQAVAMIDLLADTFAADLEAADKRGQTALMIAASQGIRHADARPLSGQHRRDRTA